MGLFGPVTKEIVGSDGVVGNIAIAGQVTVYTHSIPVHRGRNFGLFYKATVDGAGVPNLKIELEESFGKLAVASEGSASGDWVVPEGMSNIETALITEVLHIKSLSPVPAPFMRFKITGNSSGTANPATCVIRMRFAVQEE